VSLLSIVILGGLLVGAIVTLYHIRPAAQRLGVAGAFVGLFAASIGLLTSAKRGEVSGATAA